MKTYDMGARTFGSSPAWKSLKAIVKRWLDRERELLSLRNAVGMLSEARCSDAAEYDAMMAGNREARADALRLRWLAADHADPVVRESVARILTSMQTRTIAGVRVDIDAAMRV